MIIGAAGFRNSNNCHTLQSCPAGDSSVYLDFVQFVLFGCSGLRVENSVADFSVVVRLFRECAHRGIL